MKCIIAAGIGLFLTCGGPAAFAQTATAASDAQLSAASDAYDKMSPEQRSQMEAQVMDDLKIPADIRADLEQQMKAMTPQERHQAMEQGMAQYKAFSGGNQEAPTMDTAIGAYNTLQQQLHEPSGPATAPATAAAPGPRSAEPPKDSCAGVSPMYVAICEDRAKKIQRMLDVSRANSGR